MTRFADVAAGADLSDGGLKAVTLEGKELLLARVGDEYFAADDRCPHMGARLSGGTLEGTIVVCPRHGSRFDLRDGRVDRWTESSGPLLSIAKMVRPPRPLRTYPVQVREGRLMVDVEPDV
ncbi:MAG: Rieske 2Fe-2S domain-containing protein [Actinomycetia bacterium]|nr:Rieske 2Fe-2S domain-containing protein [Actinomycetes bacterium]